MCKLLFAVASTDATTKTVANVATTRTASRKLPQDFLSSDIVLLDSAIFGHH